MFSCVLSCEEETALSIIDPTSALVELNNSRRQKGRKNAGLLDITEEQLPSLEVSSLLCFQNHNFFYKEDTNFVDETFSEILVSSHKSAVVQSCRRQRVFDTSVRFEFRRISDSLSWLWWFSMITW